MLLLRAVQSAYRCWGLTGHHRQPSVPLRLSLHLQTHSMPLFNPILVVSRTPLATAHSKHRFQETLCQAFQTQGSRVTRSVSRFWVFLGAVSPADRAL